MRGLVFAGVVALAAMSQSAAAAQTLTSEQIGALTNAVNARLLRECARTADYLSYSSGITQDDSAFAVQWTGGCVDGLRDGFGRYSVQTRSVTVFLQGSVPTTRTTVVQVTEGTLVRGRRAGLWCSLSLFINDVGQQQRTTCFLQSGDTYLGTFAKDEDGSWRRVNYNGAPIEPAEVFARGSLEAESERLIAAARSGSPNNSISLQGQAAALNDLVAGASIRLSPDPSVRSLRGKRVGIVLSSRSISELQRWTAERRRVIDAMQRFRRDEQFERYFAGFVRRSDPARLAMGASATILSAGGTPFAADDLSVLQDGRADYVLVLDWSFNANIPTTVRALRALPVCESSANCENGAIFQSSFGAYLVASDMRAIIAARWPPLAVFRYRSEYDDMRDLALLLDGQIINASSQGYLPGSVWGNVD